MQNDLPSNITWSNHFIGMVGAGDILNVVPGMSGNGK